MLTQYTFTGSRTPFHIQKVTCEMLSTNQRAYVLSTMGTGKTSCPLWTFHFLKMSKLATKMLVVAPLSTLDFVWMRELLQIESPLKGVVLHGSKDKRLKLLNSDADVYIINPDGVKVLFDALIERMDIDTVTIDELATFRNKSDRTELMRQFVNGIDKPNKLLPQRATPIKWAWGMTGSPAPEAPTDVYHQARILTPHTVPRWFTRFRDMTMYKLNEFTWVPQKDAAEKAYSVLQPSVRFTLEDVSELPPYISRRIDVALGRRQHQIYEAIRKDALAIVGGQTISAVNQGIIRNKLLQISLGYVYSNNGVVTLDNQPTIQAILDILDATDHGVLIPVGYKHGLYAIADALTQAGYSVERVDGDTPAKERGVIFNRFQAGEIKAIVCHPACAAHGVTLTAADTIVWAGPIDSLELYDQFNARIRRTGQTKKQQFIHLQRTPAERKAYTSLINKQKLQYSITDLFEDEIT